MGQWIQCWSCGLKHAMREDGRCPRCQQSVMQGGGYGAPGPAGPPGPPGPPAGGGWGPPQGGYGGGYAPLKVPNYLVQAILVTLCCCTPLGIVSIVYAAQVNSKLAVGDVAGAQAASNSAKTWALVGFAVGLITSVIYALVTFAGHGGR